VKDVIIFVVIIAGFVALVWFDRKQML